MSDLISRADAIEAIASRDETDGTVKVFTGREVNEILSALPSAGQNCVLCEYYTEIETDDGIKGKCTRRTGSDLISRQDAIDALWELPSAQPKTGEWKQVDLLADRLCSVCGYGVWDSEAEEYNYCPNCGAKMEDNHE